MRSIVASARSPCCRTVHVGEQLLQWLSALFFQVRLRPAAYTAREGAAPSRTPAQAYVARHGLASPCCAQSLRGYCIASSTHRSTPRPSTCQELNGSKAKPNHDESMNRWQGLPRSCPSGILAPEYNRRGYLYRLAASERVAVGCLWPRLDRGCRRACGRRRAGAWRRAPAAAQMS